MIDGDDRTALKEEANMMSDVAQFLWCWGKTFVVGLFCVSVWSLFHALFDSFDVKKSGFGLKKSSKPFIVHTF